VRDLTRRDVRVLIDRVAERAPIMANRVLARVRKMLNLAVDHDWIDADIAARVQKPAREVSRDRVLTDEELRRLCAYSPTCHRRLTSLRPAARVQKAPKTIRSAPSAHGWRHCSRSASSPRNAAAK